MTGVRGRVALVTGCGSAGGIGFATARLLRQAGARVAITSTTARIFARLAELGRVAGETFAGMADLTDSELRSAVTYMFNLGAAEAKVPQAAAPAAPATTAAAATPAKADAGKGKAVYEANCTVCHGTGIAGAPKAGDKAAWAPRLKTGMEALYATSLKGKGAMPPKGGNLSLADADVKAAVDYLVGTAK